MCRYIQNTVRVRIWKKKLKNLPRVRSKFYTTSFYCVIKVFNHALIDSTDRYFKIWIPGLLVPIQYFFCVTFFYRFVVCFIYIQLVVTGLFEDCQGIWDNTNAQGFLSNHNYCKYQSHSCSSCVISLPSL